MSNCNKGCGISCTALAIVAGIILGIVTALLRFTAIITVGTTFLWVTFGIAVLFLGILLLSPSLRGLATNYCVCRILPVLLTGVLGTVLTAVVLLARTFSAASVIGAIISGALLLFFTLLIVSSACLVKCIANCDDED